MFCIIPLTKMGTTSLNIFLFHYFTPYFYLNYDHQFVENMTEQHWHPLLVPAFGDGSGRRKREKKCQSVVH